MDKQVVKSIRGLILFTAAVILGIIYSKEVWNVISLLVMFVKPFIIGGAIAFVVNILMRKVEKILFTKNDRKYVRKLKRPISILISLILIIVIVSLVFIAVFPQLGRTIKEVGMQIPIFLNDMYIWLENQFVAYPEILEQLNRLENMEFDWNSIISSVAGFMTNGLGSVITSTVSVASSIVGGMINVVIAIIFALYILAQKEKLGNQFDRVLKAYCKNSIYLYVKKVCTLLHKSFSSFITGQCLEAVILGGMFFVVLTILRFPYALLIGVLIAFTALIPIVGAFVGCAIGVFLIFMDDPVKAFWFLVIFLVIQQIEGNLIYPKVVGNSVGLPSIWVLVAVSVGGSMMGVVGMLMFIPIVSTAYVLLKEDVNRRNAGDISGTVTEANLFKEKTTESFECNAVEQSDDMEPIVNPEETTENQV